MEKEFYVAAMEGNVDFLEEIKSDEYLLGKTTQKNNVLHIAVQCEKIEFIEAVLRRLVPNKREVLLCEKNSKGNTPLHIAVETGNIDVVKILYDHHLLDAKTVAGDAEKPWMRIQNLEGNTAAHVAIIHDNLEIAMFLLEKDTGLACIVNESKEAPLHLALKNPASYSEKNSVQARIQRQLDLTKPITSLVPEEDTISIIKILVEQAGRVTCWRDANGFTPLHRAASLTSPYNLQITTFIIQQWPQSAEVRDNSGKSILHLLVNRMPSYREVKKLVNRKELYKLRNCQDHQGNTPLHIAALNMDIIMVRALLESRANPRIINMEGFDATSLIQQQNIIEKLKTQSMTEEECEAGERGDITFLKERLSYFGVDFLRSQDSNGQNLLHKLFKLPIDTRLLIGEEVKDEYYDFIKQVMSSYPALVCQTDLNGDTPIHVLVRHNDIPGARSLIARRLELCNKFIKEMEEEAARNNEAPYDPPWVVQNADGNTPMHQALMGSFWFDTNKVIMKLMEYNERPIELMCNKRGETLYHLVKFNRRLLDYMPPLGCVW